MKQVKSMLFGAVGLLIAGSASAQCSAGTGPARVRANEIPVTVSGTSEPRSFEELGRMLNPNLPAGAYPGKPVYGLTLASWTFEYDVETRVGTLPDGGACAYVDSVSVKVGLEPLKVLVAEELKNYPCMQQHVLEHEYEHVALYRAQVKDAVRKVAVALHSDIGKWNGQRVRSAATAKKEAADYVVKQLEAQLRNYRDNFLDPQHGAFDNSITSQSHYSMCNGQARAIEAELAAK